MPATATPSAVPVFLCVGLLLSACSSTSTRDSSATAPPVPGSVVEQPLAGKLTAEPAPQQSDRAAAAEDDLWRRLRSSFQLNIPQGKRRLERETRRYANNPNYLVRVQQRALPYLHHIVEQLEARDMPGELALLPVVESAYQPFAYSPGRAAGLWQFIPSTGRMYGLKQNWWYDGRRDPVAATAAALAYLQTLSGQFDGDWELALAAYNCGAGTVRKAIRRNHRKGLATDFWSLDLPRETEAYVPRLLAISRIVGNPEAFGVSLQRIPDQPYFRSVETGGQLDLALAAEMAGIQIEELYRLNAGFNRWATDPNGPHRLQLPLHSVDRFRQRLAQATPEQRIQWQRYQIRSGDVLGGIARRHGTSVAVLKQANGLEDNRIRAGRHLLIPVASKDPAHYSLSATERRSTHRNARRSGTKHTHEVRRGDTLWDIARSYRVGHRQLASWNGISPGDTLHPGQKLVLWRNKQTTGQTVSGNIPASLTLIGRRSPIRYKVRKGDSLSRIAQRFNVRVADLRKWNTLPGKYLQPGQRLKLYVDVTQQTL